ncbi:MAG: hypothetical protein M1839_001364 [Geoglossum umbratile]|nr:MAG: hypothetical protein M1839_001364 [Geoglossum umbratile]
MPSNTTPPPQPTTTTTTPPPRNPLRARFNSKHAVLASIKDNKRSLTVIERMELEIQKQLEDKRYEKKVNLKLWEKHRVDRGKDEGAK